MGYEASVCLVCQRQGELRNLTSPGNEDIATKFASLITIQIQANDDSLPWYICHDCIDKLNTTHDFAQRCKEAVVQRFQRLEQEVTTREDPFNTVEDEQLLPYDLSIPNKHSTGQNLAEGELDLYEDHKLAEPVSVDNVRDRTLLCKTCGIGFKKRSKLRQHMKTHDDANTKLEQQQRRETHDQERNRYEVHSERYELGKHLRKPVVEQVKCQVCGKTCRNTSAFNVHVRTHTGEQPYECHVCHQKFKHVNARKRHQLIHSKQWPHKCDQCCRAFRQSDELKRHEDIHSGKKPLLVCKICKAVYLSRKYLTIHEKTHRRGPIVRHSVPKTVKTEVSKVSTEETESETEI